MTIEDKLFELMEKLADGKYVVIFHGENGHRPPGLHVALRVHGFENLPIHRKNTVEADGESLLTQRHQEFIMELHIYGDAALVTANAIAMALDNEEVQHYCSEVLDVAFSDEAKIDSLQELRDDMTYEQRILLRMNGHHTLSALDSVGHISKVSAGGSFQGATDTHIDFTME